MKVHITQTYTVTTEHEIDAANKEEYVIQTFLGVAATKQTHAACDALRQIQSLYFKVVDAGGKADGFKIEIKL